MRGNIQQIFEIIRKINYILNKRQKRMGLVVLFMIIINACLELIGVTAILPFIQAITAPDLLSQNKLIKVFIALFELKDLNEILVLLGVMLIILYLLKNLFMIFSHYIQADYAAKVEKELSLKMLYSYLSRPYTFFLDVNSAEILRGCGDDINSVYEMISAFLDILTECFSVFMIGLFIICTDPFIAFGVLSLMALVFIGMALLFKPKIKRAGKDYFWASTKRNKAIYQSIMGIKDIFVMQRRQLFINEYEKASEMARKARCISTTLNNSPNRIVEGICVGGIIGIICIRLVLNDANVNEFIPKLGVFAMAAFKIFPSIGKLVSRTNGIIYYMPGLENVYDNMLEAELYDAQQRKYKEKKVTSKSTQNQKVNFINQLVIKNVLWQYHKAKNPVLVNVNMSFRKGESVALIGTSGAGKTTLADIILGLLRPQVGAVEMDGTDIYTIPETWAHIVGYVPQSVFLIDDTVRNNISFGLPTEQVSDKEIWDALERAQLASFIRTLPDKLDTIVGERGVKISGGQRQRIAIARALYNKPEILVLDEATAALDNETEAAVMESIDALQGQITLIIVAHRLSTIQNCDKIYEIRDGIAVERVKEEVLGNILISNYEND